MYFSVSRSLYFLRQANCGDPENSNDHINESAYSFRYDTGDDEAEQSSMPEAESKLR